MSKSRSLSFALLLVPCLAIVGCGGGGSSANDQAGYFAVQIPSAPGGLVVAAVFGMNASGVVTGGVSSDGGYGDGVPFTWSQSQGMQLLPLPAGLHFGYGAAINNAGTVVGQAYPSWQEQQGGFTANGPFHGLVWNGAAVTDIGGAGGTATQLIGINNSGEAIGSTTDSNNINHQISWTSQTGIVDLTAKLGPTASLSAIGDSGLMTGIFNGNGFAETFAYSTATGFKPLGFFGGYSTQPNAINKGGMIVGFSYQQQSPTLGFVWSQTGGQQIIGGKTTTASGSTGATSVNNSGAVVGGGNAAFIWTAKGGIKHLTPITARLPSGVTLTQAVAINDSGEIVSQGSDRNYYLLVPKSQ